MKNLMILILTVLIISLVVYSYKSYILNKNNNNILDRENTEIKIKKSSSSIKPVIDFQALLSAQCDSNFNIPLSIMPFKLSTEIYNKYNLKSTLVCYPSFMQNTEYKGTMSVLAETRDTENMPKNTLIIGDKLSKDWGMDNNFALIQNINPILSVDNVKIYVDIKQPGPYGLSSKGIWLDVKAVKDDGNLIVIASDFQIVEVKGDLLEMMKKYADNNVNVTREMISEGFPSYIVNEKYEEFKKEFINKYFAGYPNNNSMYGDSIDNTVHDVNGVSLIN